jgi:hypothetical protein
MYTCPVNSICNPSGMCICNQYYYGNNCEKSLSSVKNVKLITQGIFAFTYYGMISAMIVIFGIILIVGMLIIYFKFKDKTY